MSQINPAKISRRDLSQYVNRSLEQTRAMKNDDSPLAHTVQDRVDDMEAFAARLAQTPGDTVADIQAASSKRAGASWKRAAVSGAIGTGIAVGVTLLTGGLGAPLMLAAGAVTPGLAAGGYGLVKSNQEESFQQTLGNFANDLARGEEPGIKSGWRPSSGADTDSGFAAAAWVANPANPASPLSVL